MTLSIIMDHPSHRPRSLVAVVIRDTSLACQATTRGRTHVWRALSSVAGKSLARQALGRTVFAASDCANRFGSSKDPESLSSQSSSSRHTSTRKSPPASRFHATHSMDSVPILRLAWLARLAASVAVSSESVETPSVRPLKVE